MTVEDRLSGFLKDARDWERRATNIPGVFLLKLPSSRTRQAAIAIEINPVDSAGSATKKRGMVVRSTSALDEFNRILANQKLGELARKVRLEPCHSIISHSIPVNLSLVFDAPAFTE
jgi:hypothetical protein